MIKFYFTVLTVLFCSYLNGTEKETPKNLHEIKEVYTTQWNDMDDIDSPAFYSVNDTLSWIIATSKKSHVLVLYDADTGKFIKRVGGPGAELGQFKRPNGIHVIDSVLLVVERDNHRIQVMALPGLEPLGTIGEKELVRPYGITAVKKDACYEIYVTDNYETAAEEVPADSLLNKRIHHYRFKTSENGLSSELIGKYGDTSEKGALRVVESIFADPEYGRLLISEEQGPNSHIKIYDLQGRFTGKTIGEGLFKFEAEGVALWETAPQKGYWIFTDQGKQINLFYVFHRNSLEYLGAFHSVKTLNTDGVWLTTHKSGTFPLGAFFAVHDDGGVSAFSLKTIMDSLNLK